MWSYYCAGTLDQAVIFGIFIASLRAVGCAATLATAGLWLARRGLMTPSLSKGLSQLSVKIAMARTTNPVVLCSKGWHGG